MANHINKDENIQLQRIASGKMSYYTKRWLSYKKDSQTEEKNKKINKNKPRKLKP